MKLASRGLPDGLVAAIGVAASIFGGVANGEVIVNLNAAADVGVRSGQPTTNQNGGEVIVGNTASGSGERLHGLVRFVTSSIVVPVDQSVNVTSVVLNTLNAATNGGGPGLTIEVYDYAFDFGETTATWNNPAGNGSDSTPGGTTGLLLSSASINNSANATNSFGSSANFISIVEAAINGDDTVNLLLQRNTFTDSNTFTRFLGDEAGTGFELEVTYELVPVPEPTSGVIALVGLGVLAFLKRRC